jgi:hypothetical protein
MASLYFFFVVDAGDMYGGNNFQTNLSEQKSNLC